jgi:hypothetical protein
MERMPSMPMKQMIHHPLSKQSPVRMRAPSKTYPVASTSTAKKRKVRISKVRVGLVPLPNVKAVTAKFRFGAQDCPSLPPYCATVWIVWIGVKRQLAVVTLDSDLAGVLWKMSHIFTMTNMLICCTFTASAKVVPLLLLENTVGGFLCAEFRIVGCFPRCLVYFMKVVRFPVLMFHLNEHVNIIWRNRQTFLKWYSVALL